MIGWPAAIVMVMVIIGLVAAYSAVVSGRTEVARERVKAEGNAQYRTLAEDYATLAKETREAQKTMAADLAELRKRVESMERMMREVG